MRIVFVEVRDKNVIFFDLGFSKEETRIVASNSIFPCTWVG